MALNNVNIALGSGFFAAFFVSNGLAALAIPYYQMVLAVNPFLLGCILTLPVLFSAFVSPKIGRVLDKNFNSISSRAQVLKTSGWLAALSFSAIWLVPMDMPTNCVLLYLFCFSSVFFLSATVLNITVRTLAFSSIKGETDTTKVMAYTNYFEKFGSLIYFWMFPIAQSGLFSSLAVGIKVVGVSVGCLFIGALSHISSFFSKSIAELQTVTKHHDNNQSLQPTTTRLLNLILAITFIQFGVVGCVLFFDFYVVVYFMFDGDLSQGVFWKGVMSTSYAVVGILSIPIIKRVADSIGIVNALMVIYVVNAINGALKWWVFQPGKEYWLMFDALLGAWVWTAMGALIPALLVILSKQHQQAHGASQDAQIFAKHNQFVYLGVFLSFFVSGLILHYIGFAAELPTAANTDAIEIMRLLLTFGSFFGSMLILLALFFLKTKMANNE